MPEMNLSRPRMATGKLERSKLPKQKNLLYGLAFGGDAVEKNVVGSEQLFISIEPA